MERVRDVSVELYSFAAEHARANGVILADTKFEFGLDESDRAGEPTLVLGDEVLTPDSSRYWPADGYEVGRGAAELRQAVRARLGVRQRLGQEAARAGDPRRTSSRAPARATSRPTSASPASRSRRGSSARAPRRRGVRARVLIRPKAGILDPQGVAVERALPALGFEGVGNVHVGRLVELDVEDPSQLQPMCERLLANPLVEDYEVIVDRGSAEIRASAMKFGVLQFPGSCDEVDALQAARRVGDAELIWHGDRDLAAPTRSSCPAASPTATTCAPARSRASPRRWSR